TARFSCRSVAHVRRTSQSRNSETSPTSSRSPGRRRRRAALSPAASVRGGRSTTRTDEARRRSRIAWKVLRFHEPLDVVDQHRLTNRERLIGRANILTPLEPEHDLVRCHPFQPQSSSGLWSSNDVSSSASARAAFAAAFFSSLSSRFSLTFRSRVSLAIVVCRLELIQDFLSLGMQL